MKINLIELASKYALVFGNKVYGLSQEAVAICDHCIEIPHVETKHFLDFLEHAIIVVWDLFQKMKWNL